MTATTTARTRYSVRAMGGECFAVLYANGSTGFVDIVRLFECADDALDALIDLRALEGSR